MSGADLGGSLADVDPRKPEAHGGGSFEVDAALSFANGFVTAAVVSPVFIEPADWMEDFLEAASDEPEEDKDALRKMLWLEYGRILDRLSARDGTYAPFFCADAEGRTHTRSWAEGFFAGTEFGGEEWDRLLERDRRIGLVTLFILLEDEEILARMAEEGGPGREEFMLAAQAELPALIQNFYELSPRAGGGLKQTALGGGR